MKRINITPAADRDADEIFAYIAGDNPPAAEEQIQRIFTAAKRLADFPESGRARPELGAHARTIVVGDISCCTASGRTMSTYCALFTAPASCRASSMRTGRWRTNREGYRREARLGWSEGPLSARHVAGTSVTQRQRAHWQSDVSHAKPPSHKKGWGQSGDTVW